jgi:hypothetical protein
MFVPGAARVMLRAPQLDHAGSRSELSLAATEIRFPDLRIQHQFERCCPDITTNGQLQFLDTGFARQLLLPPHSLDSKDHVFDLLGNSRSKPNE